MSLGITAPPQITAVAARWEKEDDYEYEGNTRRETPSEKSPWQEPRRDTSPAPARLETGSAWQQLGPPPPPPPPMRFAGPRSPAPPFAGSQNPAVRFGGSQNSATRLPGPHNSAAARFAGPTSPAMLSTGPQNTATQFAGSKNQAARLAGPHGPAYGHGGQIDLGFGSGERGEDSFGDRWTAGRSSEFFAGLADNNLKAQRAVDARHPRKEAGLLCEVGLL